MREGLRSAGGDCWSYLDSTRRARAPGSLGEDGLLGFTDRECRLCCAVTLWNGKDPILKERMFGLANAEGNHGEDVKEIALRVSAMPP